MNKLGNKDIKEKYFGTKKIVKEVVNGKEVYTSGKPLLNKFSWAQIREICEAGDAANYWALGDIKTDYGNDGFARGFQLVDVHGTNTNNKYAIFMSVPVDKLVYWWLSGEDEDGCKNNYSQSHVSGYLSDFLYNGGYYSDELTTQIIVSGDTEIHAVKNGVTSGALWILSCKLFLPSAREIYPEGVVTDLINNSENTLLHSFDLFAEYSENMYSRLIKRNLTGDGSISWWTRSPGYSTYNSNVAKTQVVRIT